MRNIVRNTAIAAAIALITSGCASAPEKSSGNDPRFDVGAFINFVLTPTSNQVRKTVKLENDLNVIYLKPDLEFEIVSKAEGNRLRGRFTFSMSRMDGSDGKLFFYVVDPAYMGPDEFLAEVDVERESQIIMRPVYCDATYVRFSVVKPEANEGTIVAYDLTVLK
jgi:hypothetical protein